MHSTVRFDGEYFFYQVRRKHNSQALGLNISAALVNCVLNLCVSGRGKSIFAFWLRYDGLVVFNRT